MIHNISLKGEDLSLNSNKVYLVIDALYLDDIKEKFDKLDISKFKDEVLTKVFPYTDAPFATISPSSNIFKLKNIKKGVYEHYSPEKENYFSSDTGLIIFIEKSILIEFIKHYTYDDLIGENLEEDINLNYWGNLTSKFNKNDIGLLLSPDMHSSFEFKGGGFYKIIL